MERCKKVIKNNKVKITVPAKNEKIKLPDGSHSASDTQDYIEYIIKNHETVPDNPSIRIYLNKIEIRIMLNKDRILCWTFNAWNN